MIKIALKYAFACSVFLVTLFYVSINFGSNPLIDLNHLFFDLFILGLFVFFADQEFKKYHNDGYLHFWQGMSIGFLVYLPAALVFMIALTIGFWSDESMLADYKTQALTYLDEKSELYKQSFGEDQYQSQRDAVQNITSGYLILTASFKKLLAGLFITPVVSIFLRKKPK